MVVLAKRIDASLRSRGSVKDVPGLNTEKADVGHRFDSSRLTPLIRDGTLGRFSFPSFSLRLVVFCCRSLGHFRLTDRGVFRR